MVLSRKRKTRRRRKADGVCWERARAGTVLFVWGLWRKRRGGRRWSGYILFLLFSFLLPLDLSLLFLAVMMLLLCLRTSSGPPQDLLSSLCLLLLKHLFCSLVSSFIVQLQVCQSYESSKAPLWTRPSDGGFYFGVSLSAGSALGQITI